ncbi:MAG: hypothetical protein ACO3BI_06320, partial [Candidatus Nanopelagicales bacterium]
LISDISSVSADYLMSQKPMVIYNYLGDSQQFISSFPITKYAYVLSKDLTNASSIIDDISTNDSMAALRAQGKAHVLGDFPATEASDRFVAAIKKHL